jgi:hypothetical protein
MLALSPLRMRGAVIAPCPTPDVNPTVRASLPAIAGYLRTGHALVSLLVSFGYVLQRSARTTEDGQHRSQTLLASTGLSPTDVRGRAKVSAGGQVVVPVLAS